MSSPSGPSHPFVRQECTLRRGDFRRAGEREDEYGQPDACEFAQGRGRPDKIEDERREKDCDEWPQPPHAIAAPWLNNDQKRRERHEQRHHEKFVHVLPLYWEGPTRNARLP
jgi:hypothetical protein